MRRLTLFVGLALLLIDSVGLSLPRFSIRTGLKCQSCHVNPTGKGMRTYFGRSYGIDDLTMPTWKDASTLEDLSPELSSSISVGADVRTLFFYDRRNGTSSMMQMQGDIYFDLQINKNVRVFYDRGLYSGFEMFVIAKVLPSAGYVKIGKFMPAYGTRTDDHNAYIRGGPYSGGPSTGMKLGERSEDTGIELGVAPGVFSFQAALLNGDPGGGLSGVTGTKRKTVVARGEALLKFTDINVMAGASYFRSPQPAGTETYAGVFGAVSYDERYTLTSEVDQVTLPVGGKRITGRVFWNEFHALLTDGVDLKLGYEFFDPDEKLKSGSYSRISVGAEVFVLPGVEIRPMYRLNREEPIDVRNDEIQLLFHFFF